MPRRYYSSVAKRTTLSTDINASATTIVVAAAVGFPSSVPWTGIIDQDTVSEEIVTVTARSGTTLTVTRGVDGSTATSHTSGATFNHGFSGRDFDEPNDHVNASASVHGLAGTVVGTSDTQTLTNKTLTTPTIGSFVNATHSHTNAAGGGTITVAAISDIAANYAPLNVTINAQTGDYTLVLADAARQVEMNKATANTLTVPPNSSVAFPVGTSILVLQTGAGQTTVAAGSGVTVNATPGLKLRAQWSAATLIKRATDTWVLIGDVSA